MDTLTDALAASVPAPPADLAEAIGRAAVDDGLVDVAYAEVDGPVPLIAAVTDRGLVRIGFASDDVAAELAAHISPRVLREPRKLDDVRRQLDEYFAGHRRSFDLNLDWSLVRTPFQRAVLDAARRIPYGSVSTYTDIAVSAGNAKATRAAGSALGANPLCVVVPCHRVLRVGGGLGGYAGGLPMKETLLRLEGARF